jgi:hypothetical protein
MKTAVAMIAAVLVVGACPSLAASPKADAAVKTFKSVAADPGKLKVYCEMDKAMKALGEKEDKALETKIDGYMKELGPDFETAWSAGESVDAKSDDAKALNAALDDLSGKCK